MPKNLSVQNNFTGGLKTDFTGLNFPENACTSVDNCVFTIIGDVLRREGINYEPNNTVQSINTTGSAVSYFRWLNAGGDGQSQIIVVQANGTLFFFLTSNATSSKGISGTLLASSVSISSFTASGQTNSPAALECTYATGNGYLFVYHPYCDPFYCTYVNGVVSANIINLQIRDFIGVPEVNTPNTLRPSTLTPSHQYNLQNQGWGGNSAWSATSTTSNLTLQQGGPGATQFWNVELTNQTFTVQSGLSVSAGEAVSISGTVNFFPSIGSSMFSVPITLSGTLVSYGGSSMVIDVFAASNQWGPVFSGGVPMASASWTLYPTNINLIGTWFSAENNYPSNADIWFQYKNTSNVFSPSTMIANILPGNAQAPQGHYILPAFNQNRSSISGLDGITNVQTILRPSNGAWFQGRVWFTGINASQAASATTSYYTWTENIYFSQIVTGDASAFGECYQVNDPTDESLFDILPSDGGVIVIPGSGAIYKLFPVQNGLLVFAANGIWFITGSTGIGFTASDYTITKLQPSVQSISPYSFIDVQGTPYFWNHEGIYRVAASQQGFNVEPLTIGTIRTFYNTIPLDSKIYARGDYDPVNYVVNWVYRSTEETGVSNRYRFDSSLNFNLINKAFYPYTFGNNNSCYVCGLVYVNYPGGTLNPIFKYLTQVNNSFTFSEENDATTWLDFFSFDNVGVNYTSTFTSGYSLSGKAVMKWQPVYVYMYLRNSVPTQYLIQSVWDFAANSSSGKWGDNQLITTFNPNFGMVYRRHKIRGHGQALQFNITSVQGQPFDFMGWSILTDTDAGV